MNNYYRITAYHPEEDISAIFDSYGMFEKKWQFSAFLVAKGFKVLEVGSADDFDDGNIDKAEPAPDKIILRACGTGKPVYNGNTVEVNGKYYVPVKEAQQ